MSHRKHLTNDAHVAPEVHPKKAAHEQTKKIEKITPKEHAKKDIKSNYGNSHIKDEHGEY